MFKKIWSFLKKNKTFIRDILRKIFKNDNINFSK